MRFEHKFVEFIPKDLDDHVLYISIRFTTTVHKCACGCGHKTVTPLSPRDWKLIFDGKSISLYPSIGNWNFPCQSHYWLNENKIEWAPKWTKEEIKEGRKFSFEEKKRYYQNNQLSDPAKIYGPKSPWWKFTWFFKKKPKND
ncbi:MAG: DUF6527 family protein [Bacteroidota bacterium]|nr:DUF6527 family protein [Bacteroidota bacterium]